MARKQHTNSISLFPFLAVLVCAMGSLILLLLVMTRKMQNDKNAIDAGAEASVLAASVPDRSGEIATLERQLEAAQKSVADRLALAESLSSAVDERRSSIEDLKAELEALQKQLKEAGGGEVHGSVAGAIKDARQLKAQEAALIRQLDVAEKTLLEKRALLAKATEASEDATVLLHEESSALVSLRKQLQSAEEEQQQVSGTATLLEFSNSTGTTRTPIVINVTAKGFELLPNGMSISAAEMEGFPVRDNPLLSAVLTAHRHRTKMAVTSEPYVLLLVRPDGALAFYGAQRILSEANIHYGYELMSEDQTLVVGKADPSEVPLVRTAIEEALERRKNLYSKLMAMVQQRTGRNGADGDSDTPQRRLTVRPDGRVMETDSGERRPVDGRFYAGGIAPPASLYKNRPVGGYKGASGNQLSAEDAEKLADDFAERYAKQQEAARLATTATPPTEKPGDQDAATKAEPMRSPGERAFADSMFGGDGSLQASQLVPRGSRPMGTDSSASTSDAKKTSGADKGSEDKTGVNHLDNEFGHPAAASKSTTEHPSFSEYLASRRAKNAPSQVAESASAENVEESMWPTLSADETTGKPSAAGTPGSQGKTNGKPPKSLAFGQPSDVPSTGAPDLSRIDPKLLASLSDGKKQSGSLSTPVGITVYLDEHHMSIGQQPAIIIESDSLDLALGSLLKGINTEVKEVRRSPTEPVMPIVKFIVSPGGEKWRIPLARSLKGIGVHSATVYELTPYMMISDDTGRARLDDAQENAL